jgi:hypothetical protein
MDGNNEFGYSRPTGILHTLSSTVSHLVTSIPSMPRPEPEAEEKSRSARSNLVNWSTASLPTRASPTKMILSGLFTATSCTQRVRNQFVQNTRGRKITLARARISGSLSCIRPAVSIRTTSKSFSLATCEFSKQSNRAQNSRLRKYRK